MPGIGKLVAHMRESPKNVRYADLCRVCDAYFGEARQRGTSHRVYRMPWRGDPRVNIQDEHGGTNVYQVKQVLAAIDRLKGEQQ